MNMKYYNILLAKNRITIRSKEKGNPGVLKILFSKETVFKHPGIVQSVYGDIVVYLNDRFNVALSLTGENVITLTRNQFIIQGFVKLENAILTNPILDNSTVIDCDFSGVKEIVVIRSIVRECKYKTPVSLRVCLTNIYGQAGLIRYIEKSKH